MANCKICGRTVGCGCNLHGGKCTTCIGKESSSPVEKKEFSKILKEDIKKQEKLNKINKILQNAD